MEDRTVVAAGRQNKANMGLGRGKGCGLRLPAFPCLQELGNKKEENRNVKKCDTRMTPKNMSREKTTL